MTGRTNAGGGVQLPALTNPAAAGNIQSGYQAINGEGEVVTGTYNPAATTRTWTETLELNPPQDESSQTVQLQHTAASVCAISSTSGVFSGGFMCSRNREYGELQYYSEGSTVDTRITAELSSDGSEVTLYFNVIYNKKTFTLKLYCVGW